MNASELNYDLPPLASESIEKALTVMNKRYAAMNGIMEKPQREINWLDICPQLTIVPTTVLLNILAKRERTIHDPRPHKPYISIAENVRLYAVDYDGDFQGVDIEKCELWHGMLQDWMEEDQERDLRLRYESALEKHVIKWEVKYANR